MLIVCQSDAVSVSFSLLCECVIGILFEFGNVASMTGSTMMGLSLLDIRCVVRFLQCGVMMGDAVPGVLFMVFLRFVRGFVFVFADEVGFVVVVIGGVHWRTL